MAPSTIAVPETLCHFCFQHGHIINDCPKNLPTLTKNQRNKILKKCRSEYFLQHPQLKQQINKNKKQKYKMKQKLKNSQPRREKPGGS